MHTGKHVEMIGRYLQRFMLAPEILFIFKRKS